MSTKIKQLSQAISKCTDDLIEKRQAFSLEKKTVKLLISQQKKWLPVLLFLIFAGGLAISSGRGKQKKIFVNELTSSLLFNFVSSLLQAVVKRQT